MSFLIRNIEIELTEASLGAAIAEIELIQSMLKPAMGKLIDTLTKHGATVAKAYLVMYEDPAYDTGELYQSIESVPFDGEQGYISTDCPYSIYVEFGTGPRGNGAPHPLGGSYRGTGWKYFNERVGHVMFTYGMSSRPFMYSTMRNVQEEAESRGGRIVAEYLAG